MEKKTNRVWKTWSLCLLMGITLTVPTVMTACVMPHMAVEQGPRQRPGRPGSDVDRWLKQKYPGCRVLDRDRDNGRIEVKIRHMGEEKIVLFGYGGQWQRTLWEVKRYRLPKAVTKAVEQQGFDFWHIDDNDNMIVDTPHGRYYAVQVDSDRRDGILVVSEKGAVMRRYTNNGWNNGRLRGNRDWNDRRGDDDDDRWDDGEDRFDEGDDEWDDRH